jgi:endonuclease G
VRRRLLPRRLTPLALLIALATYLWFWLTPTSSPDVHGGLPKVRDWKLAASTHVLQNPGFAIGYNEFYRVPLWVAFIAEQVPYRPAMRRPEHFEMDRRTLARVSSEDYRDSGYDRGHLAPNFLISRLYGERAQLATFRMSNIAPQTPRLNQLLWQRLEEAEADIVAPRAEQLWIVTGPLFGIRPRLRSGVAVPDAFYRIWLDRDEGGALRAIGFIVPQEVRGDEPLTKFVATVRDIETKSGLDFFSQLADDTEDELENVAMPGYWQIPKFADAPARYADKFKDRR